MSTEDLRSALSAVDLEEHAPYLIFGRKVGKRVHCGTYPINEDMQNELRDIAQQALQRIDELEMTDYVGPTSLEVGQEGLYVPSETLNADADILALLTDADDLEQWGAHEVLDKSLSFYAIGIGSTEDDRVFFVRRKASTLQASNLLLGRLAAEMRPIRTDIVYLSRSIDFILMREGAVIFDMRAFEQYVQDPVEIDEQVDEDLDAVAEELPFEDETLEALRIRTKRGALLRRRLRSLLESDYFSALTIDDVRRALRRLGREPREYINKGRLKFTMDQAPFVLKVLDESAWPGEFSGQIFSTNAKRREQ